MLTNFECAICKNQDPFCFTHLEIPICSRCWRVKKPLSNFFYDPEIDKIGSKIFLGNKEAQMHKPLMKALFISNILVVGSELEIYHPDDFIYKKINVDDLEWEDISQFFYETYAFIEEAKGNVYVHCAAGLSRSPTIVIAYIMQKEGKSFEEALQITQERRSSIHPNKGFLKQLRAFGEKLKQEPFPSFFILK